MTPANPLDALPLVQALHTSPWLFPAVETVHIVGFVILVGSVLMFDLRVLGLSKGLPVRALARHLLPWSWGALALVVPTGFLMFLAHALDYLASGPFKLKMGLVMLAGINAIVFHTGPYQGVAAWDRDRPAPLAAKLSVAASMVIWLAVIACGRAIVHP